MKVIAYNNVLSGSREALCVNLLMLMNNGEVINLTKSRILKGMRKKGARTILKNIDRKGWERVL